ncbi:MAG TPA: glycosyltransferase family 4 protein [Candidatus Sulfotelmatobacter sp.]|jgi:glycosyltransferase involved in cell wall biosynthesis
MPTVAYLANQYPVTVEPYVANEICALRGRGLKVISGSVRRPGTSNDPANSCADICIEPFHLRTLLRAFFLIAKRWKSVSPLVTRALLSGNESLKLRLKAILHTLLGACYATLLQDREVDHIHVHHGYFGSWIAMTAASLLGVPFSMTLHGSDLLLNQAYLAEKFHHCRFCITISEYNRQYILQHFPEIAPSTIIVSRLGVDVISPTLEIRPRVPIGRKLSLLTAGRLHPVKNHAFLIYACARLRGFGLDFECRIAGEGLERNRLESLIREKQLQDQVTLLGHIAPQEMNSLYQQADLFLLTSLSEGIPLVLMEAMANALIVLAPAITGIPELISHEKTGFLYQPGNLDEFVNKVLAVHRMTVEAESSDKLRLMRHAARIKVFHDFNRQKNLDRFSDLFLQSISPKPWSSPHENSVLQQVQLSV